MKNNLLRKVKVWGHKTFPCRQESINALRYHDWIQYLVNF